jgi:hypothetical protein
MPSRVTLTTIEPGSKGVKGTDLLLLADFHGCWHLSQAGTGTELSKPFRTLAAAREWLEVLASELDRRDR